jgi:hypothetical protein
MMEFCTMPRAYLERLSATLTRYLRDRTFPGHIAGREDTFPPVQYATVNLMDALRESLGKRGAQSLRKSRPAKAKGGRKAA